MATRQQEVAKEEWLKLIEADKDNGGPAVLHRFIEPVKKDDVIPEDITKGLSTAQTTLFRRSTLRVEPT